VVKQILAKSDGIPLFVEELTKTVLEAGQLVEEADGYRLGGPLPAIAVPATLQDSLMARLDRLASVKEIALALRSPVCFASKLMGPIMLGQLSASAALDEAALKVALAKLEEAELATRRGVPPEAVYSFKHALVQDAAYESLLKSRRQVLHRRIGEALRDRFPTIAESQPEVVAHHFTRAGLNEAAVEWWGKAGERALRRFAHNEAIAHLERAIGLAQELGNGPTHRLLRLRSQITYGNALRVARGFGAPETTAAFVVARELAAATRNIPERFSAYYGLWSGSFQRGELTLMREMAEEFLRDIESQPDSPEAGMAHRIYGMTCWFRGDFVEARAHLERILKIYDNERDRDFAFRFGQDMAVPAMCYLALSLWALGEVDRARQLMDEAVTHAVGTKHVPTVVYAYAHASLFEMVRHDGSRTLPQVQACLALAREHEMLLWIAVGTFLLAWARWQVGDKDFEVGMRDGIELMRRQHLGVFMPLHAAAVAEAEAKAGRLAVGLATLDAELAAIEHSGQHWFDAEMHRSRGELLLQYASDVVGAETALVRAIEIARSQQTRTFELRAALALAKLYQVTGRGEVARELLGPSVSGFIEGPELPEIAKANRLLASLEPARSAGI
jgi:predicted ATPase